MPPRISRTSTNSRPKDKKPASSARPPGKSSHTGNAKKSSKRALDAFAIAAHEVGPEKFRGKRSRMGELEGPTPQRKRARDEDEDEDEDEEDEGPKRRRRGGDDSMDEGSDSEGNTWTMGQLAEDDDDSDIDSDEAFGESDEERFEGWVFRGSESTHGKKSKKPKSKKSQEEDMDVDMNEDIDLDEGESADGEEDDESDWGDEAIDLATALDQYVDSEEEEAQEKKRKEKKKAKKAKKAQMEDSESESEPSEQEEIGGDGAADYSSSGFSSEDDDKDDEDEDDKAARLRDLISSLPEDEEKGKSFRKVDVHESGAPSEFGVMRKVDLLSFKPKITDPEKKKSLKLLQDDVKPSKRNDIARRLEAPLPKRQQDKLDRAVASEKATETLGRWVDTVKQNRRAEHLSFPLKSVHASEPMGESRLQPTTTAAPANDLEAAIQNILQQSGLSTGKDDEEVIAKWENLQTNKLPLEEVAKRRALLRKERELLFREEVRAKRIKKIKSKAYRRVHRKERERMAEREKDALRADGIDVSEDEKEYNDRRRAEERMGAKHRESKWAKGIKESGRAAWDEDARTGVTEMARRNEELRRRIEGKEVRDEDEDGSDFTDEEEEVYDSDMDQDQVLQKQLGKLKENPFSTGAKSKIGEMQFMQRAEAAKKARNDATVEEMRRELAGEEEHSSDEDENAAKTGRKKFAPVSDRAVPAIKTQRGEFEERDDSDDEDNQAAKTRKARATAGQSASKEASSNPYLTKATKSKTTDIEPDALWKAQDTVSAVQEQPKSKSKSQSSTKNKTASKSKSKAQTSDDEEAVPEPQVSAPDADGWQTVTYNNSDDDEDDIENEGIDLDTFTRNQALTASAFAGDNVESEFASEKAAIADEESEKVVTNYLPGWGAWTGSDLTKNQQRNRGAKSVTKKDGVKQSKRKDLRLEKVIINERKVKKNDKFLAQQLPFPFENREQYERSLRVPKGPEWTTKVSFQDATKPRVMVKQGVIKPMQKPLV